MWKLVTILDFSLKCLGFGAMIAVCGYNIVLMWNSDNIFNVEFIVLFGLLITLCGWMLGISIKELK